MLVLSAPGVVADIPHFAGSRPDAQPESVLKWPDLSTIGTNVGTIGFSSDSSLLLVQELKQYLQHEVCGLR